MGYNKRIGALEREIKKRKLDSFLVTNEANVSYLSGFSGHDSTILITPEERYFITDSRYLEDAQEAVKGFRIELVKQSTYANLKEIVASDRLKTLGFESMNMPYEVALRLGGMIGKTKLVPLKGLVEPLRAVKDAQEIVLIKRSISTAKEVWNKVKGLLKPGITEVSLSDRIELEFIKRGSRISFDPIVASGHNSSKPHARPTSLKVRNDSVVMVDLGCRMNGYNSDLTRTVFLGNVKAILKKIYDIVKTAQEKAIEDVKPGTRISDIDNAARAYIQDKGFGKYFGHALGHGVGLEVHEAPSVSRLSQDVLMPGMVFTIEPAIYIPRTGGVRIEDMVLVTEKGSEILTR